MGGRASINELTFEARRAQVIMAIRALEDLLGAAYIFGREPTEQERALLSWTWEATRRTTNSIAIYLQVHGGWSSDAHAALMVSITEGD